MPLRFFGFAAALRFALCVLLIGTAGAVERRHVLILNSYNQGMIWTDEEVDGIRQVIARRGSTDTNIEYMDAKRMVDPVHLDNLQRLFAHKYSAFRFDAIVATDNDAFEFMRRYRDELFPGVPVVFCGVNHFQQQQLAGLSKFTGIAEIPDLAATLGLMLRLHPKVSQVVVVVDDTTTGKVLVDELNAVAPPFHKRFHFELLNRNSLEEIAQRLSRIDANSLVLLMPFASDRDHGPVSNEDVAELVSAKSPVPVYSSWEMFLGHGIVGGNIITGEAQGRAAGEMLLRILDGEDASAIPVQFRLPGVYAFDSRQLSRFNIRRDRLPSDSLLINQPWYDAKKTTIRYLVAGATTIVVLLWALWVNLARKRRAEAELRIAAKAFELQVAMIVTDQEATILKVNQAFTETTGYSAEEAIGQKTSMLKSGRHDKSFYRDFWKQLTDTGSWQGVIWNRRKNRSIFAEWITINAVYDVNGAITNYVCSFSDITHNKEAEAEIHRLAYYDQLTQLPNRRLLQDRIGQALASAARNGAYGAILFLDLDNFNTLNDTQGHDKGDQFLIVMAKRIQDALRRADTVARLGGDDFAIILEDLGSFSCEAAARTKRTALFLGSVIAEPARLGAYEAISTSSVGICLFDGSETVEQLLKNAEIAMYQAKAGGKNGLRFYDPQMQAALDQRSALESDLRQALNNQELLLYYQSQVDRSGHIIGAEILLRWKHPQRGFISPADFIPLAEETGLILPIGDWVLESACRQIAAWSGHPRAHHLQVAVNVSSRQFRQDDFVDRIHAVLERTGVDPTRLKLELTESLVLDDIEHTAEKMQRLKTMGVSFSMDDFGTGYSSLAYLARLPLDELKIDRSFVLNVPGSHNDEIIAQTIITMGHSLGMNVTAEGVETAAQHAFLNAQGCHRYQGYFFGKPVPIVEFVDLLPPS